MSKFKRKIEPYLFILPHYLMFIVFFAIPAVMALYVSFCKWDFVSAPKFVGLKNYITLLADKDSYYFGLFWSSFRNTLGYVVVSVPLLILVPMFLAVLLTKLKKGAGVFQSIFYFP